MYRLFCLFAKSVKFGSVLKYENSHRITKGSEYDVCSMIIVFVKKLHTSNVDTNDA